MIAAWMVYSLAVGAALTGAALVIESALRARGRPARWSWVAAILVMLALSAASAPGIRPDAGSIELGAGTDAWEDARWGALISRAYGRLPAALSGAGADRILLAGWGAASALGVIALLRSGLRVRRRRREWRFERIEGEPVRVSRKVGPAIHGLFRPEIVVPRWVLSAPARERGWILRHEVEHRRARDPLLIGGARILTILVPWHLGIALAAARLRRAIEVDCDRRTMGSGEDRRAYAALLLEAAERGGALPRILAAPLAGSSDLEVRLRGLLRPRVSPRRGRAVEAGATVATLLTLSLLAPPPPQAVPPWGLAGAAPEGPGPTIQLFEPTMVPGPAADTGPTPALVLEAFGALGELQADGDAQVGAAPEGESGVESPSAVVRGGRGRAGGGGGGRGEGRRGGRGGTTGGRGG
jgi:uncharacterized membrane protein YgcG